MLRDMQKTARRENRTLSEPPGRPMHIRMIFRLMAQWKMAARRSR